MYDNCGDLSLKDIDVRVIIRDLGIIHYQKHGLCYGGVDTVGQVYYE